MLVAAIVFLAFVCGLMLTLALTAAPASNNVMKNRLELLMQKTGGATKPPRAAELILSGSFAERVVRPTLRFAAAFAERSLPGLKSSSIRASLNRAGNPGGLSVSEFNGARVLCVAAFLAAGLAVASVLDTTPLMRTTAFGLSLLIGVALPDTYLQKKAAQRQLLIRKSLPETIDLLLVSIEAGMGFDGAVDKAVEKMHGPLADELARTLQEMRLGKSRGAALKDMAARVDVQEISTFVASVHQADFLGVSISRVLHVQSETIRSGRVQNIREAAGKLPVKMLFPMVLFIFPAVFIVLLGPGFMKILETF